MAHAIFDPFEALGLPRDASDAAIKSQYHALARKYHPSRTNNAASTEARESLADHFHHVHQAWKLLSRPDDRRRRVELLKLLELQQAIETRFSDLLTPDTPDEPAHSDHSGHLEQPSGSELDGHVSSDADEDLPNPFGLQRRQTFLARNAQSGGRRTSVDSDSPTTPSKKKSKWQALRRLNQDSSSTEDKKKAEDYFTETRKKLEKLQKKELAAFEKYRDAMVKKFNAEEEADRQRELYERAKWRREYLERAPRGTTERMRSFQRFMGAVTAFEQHAPRQRNRSMLSSYSVMSPIVGPGEAPQFLMPGHGTVKHKGSHRRNWSSDISADQTDSSDEEPGSNSGFKGIPIGGHWRHHPRFRRNGNSDHQQQSQVTANTTSTDSPSQSAGPWPFKLIIRQATDLGTIVEAQDSSSETVSKSSRSPSPQPFDRTSTEHTRFTVVSRSEMTETFGMQTERRARSPSPLGTRLPASSPHKQREHSPSSAEGIQCRSKQIGKPRHQTIPHAHVHLLPRNQKSYILSSEPATDQDLDPAVLLERLRRLDPEAADKFEIKPDMEQLFNFRLIYANREVIPKQHQSFIALSYRRKLIVQSHQHHFTLPLQPEIFQAVWDERQSDNEGLWIDQISIKQDSEEEITISMSAMDMVYRSARLVVVALDDIKLQHDEAELLEQHMDEYNRMTHVPARQRFRHKQPPYLDSHEKLYKVIRKLLQSSWFQRAWCRHEMRLAKHLMFLVPRAQPAPQLGIDVLRFNSKCIAHLLDLSAEVPFESNVESVKPALHAFFRDRSKMAPDERQMSEHHGNFSAVVAEVFAMKAGGNPLVALEQQESDARKDKISIILNTMECGLALKGQFRRDGFYGRNSECYHDLTLLAIAARDPGALCSVGSALPITDSVGSWIYTPTVVDAGLNNTKTLQRLPANIRLATCVTGHDQFLRLDMKFFEVDKVARHIMEQETTDLARQFVEACGERKWGRHRKQYLIHDRTMNLLFGNMKDVYVNTLACVFACGPDWMGDVCQRYSMSRWKVDLRGAEELLIALQNTRGRWPVSAWNERAAAFVMDFVNFLVIRGLPRRQITKPEPWRPFWVSTPSGGKVLTFEPVNDANVRAAIPTALLNPDYVHLARLWLLKPRSLEHDQTHQDIDISNVSDWTLLGKSVLFSDELSIEGMAAYALDYKEGQKVYGRRRNLAMNGTPRGRSPQ